MSRILLIVLLLAFVACSPKVAVPVVQLKDSTHNLERVQTTTVDVELPPDSSLVRALLECDSLGRVYLRELVTLQGERVKQDFSLKNGVLKVAATDNARERHHSLHNEILSVRYKEVPVPYPVEVNRLSSWQAFQLWVARILMLMLALWAARGYFKGKLIRIFKPFKS